MFISDNERAEIEGEKNEIDNLNQINPEIIENKNKDSDQIKSNNRISEYITKSMESNLRFISGSVMFPGTYPVADKTFDLFLVQLCFLEHTL